jgi:dihydrofolate reductase
VVAAAENGVIGRANALPWRLPADLRHFKALTLGKAVLMGRSTHESIGRALPGRTNYVLSRRPDYVASGCEVVPSIAAALGRAHEANERRAHAMDERKAHEANEHRTAIMVIGGADVYRQCLPLAERIHLTLVHAHVDGDTVFDGWRGAEWRETQRVDNEADAKHEWPYSFITLER